METWRSHHLLRATSFCESIISPRSSQSFCRFPADTGLKRIRPCLMTSVTTILGLAPIFLFTGRGSDVMQPMAIPSVGGMSVALITLFVIPCCYCLVKEWQFHRNVSKTNPIKSQPK